MDAALVYTLVKAIVLPPASLLALAVIGLLLMAWRRRLALVLVWGGVVGLVGLSLPIVERGLIARLDPPGVFRLQQAAEAGALVILAGGVRRHALEYGGDTLGRLTLERVRYGARLARETRLPVLVTGGTVEGAGRSEAALMREALQREFGVAVRWVEDRSRNTHENATLSARILLAEGIRAIVLVGHAFDMKRATIEFRSAGLKVFPAATGLRSPAPWTWREWVPSAAALLGSYYAVYELIANLRLAIGAPLHGALPGARSSEPAEQEAGPPRRQARAKPAATTLSCLDRPTTSPATGKSPGRAEAVFPGVSPHPPARAQIRQ